VFPKSISKACKLLGTTRSRLQYKSIKDDTALTERLQQFAKDHPREGFWKGYYRIRNEGFIVNHKRLHRVYKLMGLPMRRKVKKRLPLRIKEPLQVALILIIHGV
jgi:putative transposase